MRTCVLTLFCVIRFYQSCVRVKPIEAATTSFEYYITRSSKPRRTSSLQRWIASTAAKVLHVKQYRKSLSRKSAPKEWFGIANILLLCAFFYFTNLFPSSCDFVGWTAYFEFWSIFEGEDHYQKYQNLAVFYHVMISQYTATINFIHNTYSRIIGMCQKQCSTSKTPPIWKLCIRKSQNSFSVVLTA